MSWNVMLRRPLESTTSAADGSELRSMSTAVHVETPVSVTIITLGYRVRCTAPGCRNLGRMILRHADAGGRPIDNAEFCLRHGRSRIKSDRAAGLRVYDDREDPADGSESRNHRV
jgi:hypothetical protein